jgi:titin
MTYQVVVRARNAAGGGDPSPAAELIPRSRASAPRMLVAAARNHAAVLTFRASADNGGTAISGYEVSTDGGDSWSELSPASGDGGVLRATVGDLSNDTEYQVRVRAITEAGPGAATAAVSVTPLAPPAAPARVVATAHTATITVSWDAPAGGGAAVTGYTAIASPGPATCDTRDETTCVLGAQTDVAYTVTVVAHSASGDSAASVPSKSVTAASPVIPPTPPETKEKLDTDESDLDAVQPSDKITIRGSGYAPNSTVEIILYSSPVSLGSVVTDDNGEFSIDVALPPGVAGSHSLVALGADPFGNVRAMRLDVTVAPTSTGMPTTGGAPVEPALFGLLLVLIGAALMRVSRGRSRYGTSRRA